jgi:Vanillate O-demethylase oxygenase C-terminal domain
VTTNFVDGALFERRSVAGKRANAAPVEYQIHALQRRLRAGFEYPGDAELTASIRNGHSTVFSEDIVMLEAQQRNMPANPRRASPQAQHRSLRGAGSSSDRQNTGGERFVGESPPP